MARSVYPTERVFSVSRQKKKLPMDRCMAWSALQTADLFRLRPELSKPRVSMLASAHRRASSVLSVCSEG
jgi:hypothetical protein